MSSRLRAGPQRGLVLGTYRHSPTCGKSRRRVSLYRGMVAIGGPRVARVQVGGGRRKPIEGLSPASQRRLRVLLACTSSAPAWFVTLTYQTAVSVDQAKRDLKVWAQSVERTAERAGFGVAMVWRVELTRRGRPHFHILLWVDGGSDARWKAGLGREALDSYSRLVTELSARPKPGKRRPSDRWCDTLGALTSLWVRQSGHGLNPSAELARRAVHVREIASDGQAAAYMAKYVSKVTESQSEAPSSEGAVARGRQWGRCGSRALVAPVAWCRLEVPATDDRIAELAEALDDMGHEWAADVLLSARGAVRLTLSGQALREVWNVVILWAVPIVRGPPVPCEHPSCWGRPAAILPC